MPYTPQKLAGLRTEPPPSLPSENGPRPVATAAPDPALDPPEVRSGSHGLRVGSAERGLAGAAVAELGHLRLADHDRARPADPLDHDVVLVRDEVGVGVRAERRAHPRGEDQVLDAGRAPRPAGRPRRRGRDLGFAARLASCRARSGTTVANAVQRGVQPVQTFQHRVDHLDRADLLGRDRPRQRAGVHPQISSYPVTWGPPVVVRRPGASGPSRRARAKHRRFPAARPRPAWAGRRWGVIMPS